jgi:hypothetical protein
MLHKSVTYHGQKYQPELPKTSFFLGYASSDWAAL